jgi:hypothetical protein
VQVQGCEICPSEADSERKLAYRSHFTQNINLYHLMIHCIIKRYNYSMFLRVCQDPNLICPVEELGHQKVHA